MNDYPEHWRSFNKILDAATKAPLQLDFGFDPGKNGEADQKGSVEITDMNTGRACRARALNRFGGDGFFYIRDMGRPKCQNGSQKLSFYLRAKFECIMEPGDTVTCTGRQEDGNKNEVKMRRQ
jgi:hypothetical protein